MDIQKQIGLRNCLRSDAAGPGRIPVAYYMTTCASNIGDTSFDRGTTRNKGGTKPGDCGADAHACTNTVQRGARPPLRVYYLFHRGNALIPTPTKLRKKACAITSLRRMRVSIMLSAPKLQHCTKSRVSSVSFEGIQEQGRGAVKRKSRGKFPIVRKEFSTARGKATSRSLGTGKRIFLDTLLRDLLLSLLMLGPFFRGTELNISFGNFY